MDAISIWIRVRHVRSADPFIYWRPAGAMMMFEPFERIQNREFPPINFLSKSEWNRLGKRPASYLYFSSAEVIDFYDRYDIPYK